MVPTMATIAVLCGGFSSEREVSLNSGSAIKKSLDNLRYKSVEIDMDKNVTEKLKQLDPDLVFIALHGPYGEDGCIQGILEISGIKYTHSGVMASAIAMNKVMSKHIFRSLGIDTPSGYVISKEDVLKNNVSLDYPYVLKPTNEGSSVGVHLILSHEDYLRLISDQGSSLKDEMIAEEYIAGLEIQTAVLLDEAIGTIEVRPKTKFYDYQAKYTDGLAEHVFPAQVPDHIYSMTLQQASKVHRFLGCKSVSRSDFRYDPKSGVLKMLEINTHPGFTELSLVPEIAKLSKGIEFDELVRIIVEDSLGSKKEGS
ncbi:D-alanine--D-alanine ligase-like [Planococcus citri]|uniref:D-alanine--d-alanine ligase n=1 Tax=Planococcus citri TaxID=170843 RepID=S5NFD1_9HEMI|nr:d-alanine--d-alanine ligase [Planococcus citri]